MKIQFFIVLCASVLVIMATAISPGGGMAAFSQDGLSYLNKAAITPAIKHAIENLDLKEIKTEKSGIEIHALIAARTYDVDCDSCVSLEFDAGGGGGPSGDSGIDIKLDSFSVRLHWRFDWHKSGIIPVSGAGVCESKIKVGKMSTKMHVGAAGGKPSVIPSGNVDVSIDDTDMGCDGLSGAAVNVINHLFEDKIIKALEAQMQQVIVLGVQAVGKMLNSFSLDVPITDGFATMRFDLTGQPNTTADAIALPMVADLVKTNSTTSGTPYPPPQQLPAYDKSVGGYCQIYLSDYSFNTALYSYWKNGRLSRTVDPANAPAGLKQILKTAALSTVAPAIATKYPNMSVQLVVNLDPDTTQFMSVSAQQGVLASITLIIDVNPITPSGPVNAFTLSAPMQLNLGLGIAENKGNLSLTSNVSLMAPITITSKNSTVGTINTDQAAKVVNSVVSSDLVPLLNKALHDGFPFPSIPLISLKNSKLLIMDEFIRIVTDFDWVAPAPPPSPPPPSGRRRRRKSSVTALQVETREDKFMKKWGHMVQMVSVAELIEHSSNVTGRRLMQTPPAPPAPGSNPFAMLNSIIQAITGDWSSIVSAFKSSYSEQLDYEQLTRGWSKFKEATKVFKGEGLHYDKAPEFFQDIQSMIQIPANYSKDFQQMVQFIQFFDKEYWSEHTTTFNIGEGGSASHFTMMANNNQDTSKIDILFLTQSEEFALAPDVFVITESHSYLGGIWSTAKLKFDKRPAAISSAEIQFVNQYFLLLAYQEIALAEGLPTPPNPNF